MQKTLIITIIFLLNWFTYSSAFETEDIFPKTASNSIIILDRKTLVTLYEKNSKSIVSMASTTKIMTAILVIENGNLDDQISISKNSVHVSGSKIGLKYRSCVSVRDLLYGLMLKSGNDCAIALSEYLCGSTDKFVKLMNQKAYSLGLLSTNFESPHGLDSKNHYTTAYDLALLSDYALKNETFKKIVSTKHYIITYNNQSHNITNTNPLLDNIDGVYGIKTGFTFNAGRCLVTGCKRNDLDIICVILGANTKQERNNDTINLINYVFNNYSYIDLSNLVKENYNFFLLYYNKKHFNVIKSSSFPIINLERNDNYLYPINNKYPNKLTSKIYYFRNLNYHFKTNSIIGKITIYNNDIPIYTNNLLLNNSIIKNNTIYYFKYMLKNLFFLV